MHSISDIDKQFKEALAVGVDVDENGDHVVELHWRKIMPEANPEAMWRRFHDSKEYKEFLEDNPSQTVGRTLFLENVCQCLRKPKAQP